MEPVRIEGLKWVRRASAMLASAAALISAAPAVATPRPNIVVIQTDDQTVGELTHGSMPHVLSALAGHGTTFGNYIVASPQCCPSRASLITGDYPHNTGVLSNTPGYDDLVDKRNVLPAWLRRVGYRTIHVGKYLNGYESARPAPGWSRWFTEVSPLDYYDYAIARGGRFVHFGNKPVDYLTRVLKLAAIRLVRHAAHAHKPFYLELDEHAPHGGGGGRGACSGHGLAVPGPADASRFQGVPLPQEALPPGARSLDEQNVSDKPSFMRALPRIDGTTLGSMRKRYDCALAAIHSVDRSVGGLFSALRHAGLWSSTVVILTSDNGFFFGEHRLPQGKDLPYEEAIRQPLIIRVPRAYAPHQVARSPVAAANIDLAPTILKLAGATPCRAARHCRTLDGRSLLGPVKGRTGAFRGRHLLVELSEPSGVVALDPRPGVCAFKTVWRPSEMFSIYSRLFKAGTGHCEAASVTERYNLRTDPLELRNVAQSSSRHDRELSRRLARLARCAGVRGRDRRVAGRPYCE